MSDEQPKSGNRSVSETAAEGTGHGDHRRPLLMAPSILVVLIIVAVAVLGPPATPPGPSPPAPLAGGPIAPGETPAPAEFPTVPGGTPAPAEFLTVAAAQVETVVPPVPATIAPTEVAAGTFPVSDAPVPILMYHYIRPDPGPDDPVGRGLSVSPELFADHLAYLAEQGYSTVTMAELADAWQGRRTLPAKPIVLTFDDGYRDFYTNAWPILDRFGFSATVYVFDAVIDQPDYLTRDMILELDASGTVDIGSHTTYHNDLPGLSDGDAEAEIIGSKRALEGLLGHPVRTFCYPHGSYSERDVALVRAGGYALAVTTEWGHAGPSMAPELLPRIRMWGWTTTEELAGWL